MAGSSLDVDDLDELFAIAVGAQTAVGSPDDSLADLSACAALATTTKKYEQRSAALTQHMRDCKEIARLARGPAVAEHSGAKLARHNALAVRPQELINLAERKEPTLKGKGAYKVWLTGGLLRCCFGHPATDKRSADPWMSASKRLQADTFQASHRHVQRCMSAVAATLCKLQQTRLLELEGADHASMVISFDETEQELQAS
jgi:hypothetical protein